MNLDTKKYTAFIVAIVSTFFGITAVAQESIITDRPIE